MTAWASRSVGIGASAGGLDACRKFAGALPAGNGMAFILVQHLDPTYESMMVDLLTGHTPMTVVQAKDGMPVERDHFYVIPPGTYLSVARRRPASFAPAGAARSAPAFRFPAAFLAEECGERGHLRDPVRNGGGRQPWAEVGQGERGTDDREDPGEAGYDGMPRSAITTGLVDIVLAAADIPRKLVEL